MKQYRTIIRMIWKESKWILCAYTLSILLGTMLPAIVAYSQKSFIESLERSLQVSIIIVTLIIYVMMKFMSSVFQYIDSYFAHKLIFRVKLVCNKHLINKLYREEQEFFYNSSFNDQLKKVERGMEKIPFQIFKINGVIIKMVVLVFVHAPILIVYSPTLMIMVLVNSIFSLITTRKIAKGQYEVENELTRQQRKADYFSNIFSNKSNAKEIRIWKAEHYFFQKWHEVFRGVLHQKAGFQIKKEKLSFLINTWNISIKILVLIVLFYQLVNQKIELGTFTYLYTVFPAVCNQFDEVLQSLLGDMYTNCLTINHFINYIMNENDTQKEGEIIDFQKLELLNVSYKYPASDNYAVKNVSLSINKGEIVSILGYNGSGKTTISKLITGLLRPSEGKIYFNGTEIEEYSRDEIYSLFGIAYQDFPRYYLSVKENVEYGYIEKRNDENILRALDTANCEEVIAKLPVGVHTRLGKDFYDDGVDLSGGEWQKIALARAYMGDHAILILDEPTASIDPMKELEMLKHFRENLKDRTAILISHRIGFARLADKIIMMDNGEIVETGSHEKLIQQDGLYSKIFYSQKELYD